MIWPLEPSAIVCPANGEGVNHAACGISCSRREVIRQPRQLGGIVGKSNRLQPDAVAHQVRGDFKVEPELRDNIRHHAIVGCRGRGADRHVGGKRSRIRHNPAMIGAKIMALIGDRGEPIDQNKSTRAVAAKASGQEVLVSESLRRNDQQINLSARSRCSNASPVIGVGGIDGCGANAKTDGGVDLISHQCQQPATPAASAPRRHCAADGCGGNKRRLSPQPVRCTNSNRAGRFRTSASIDSHHPRSLRRDR